MLRTLKLLERHKIIKHFEVLDYRVGESFYYIKAKEHSRYLNYLFLSILKILSLFISHR